MVADKMTCPKCGRQQTPNAECIQSGVIIEKYGAKPIKRRESAFRVDHQTKSRQKKLKALGKVFIFVIISIPVVFMVLFFSAFLPHEIKTEEHLDSVSWLPPSATDISYTKRGGFGWIKNYKCSLSEEDFYWLAAEEGWKLQQDGNMLFYEKRHPNGGHVSVIYKTDSKRLSVNSSHR